MAKTFTPTKLDRRAIERAMERLDKAKATAARRRAKAAAAKRRAREHERRREKATAAAATAPRGLSNAARMRWPIAGWKVMCARMDPALWYGASQIFALMADAPRGSVKAWLWDRAMSLGYIERAGNPDFDPELAGSGVTQERYLYRIAQNRTQEAQEWREALGMGTTTGEA
jgi:hypothetical protein